MANSATRKLLPQPLLIASDAADSKLPYIDIREKELSQGTDIHDKDDAAVSGNKAASAVA
jgi:hypothetical protein